MGTGLDYLRWLDAPLPAWQEEDIGKQPLYLQRFLPHLSRETWRSLRDLQGVGSMLSGSLTGIPRGMAVLGLGPDSPASTAAESLIRTGELPPPIPRKPAAPAQPAVKPNIPAPPAMPGIGKPEEAGRFEALPKFQPVGIDKIGEIPMSPPPSQLYSYKDAQGRRVFTNVPVLPADRALGEMPPITGRAYDPGTGAQVSYKPTRGSFSDPTNREDLTAFAEAQRAYASGEAPNIDAMSPYWQRRFLDERVPMLSDLRQTNLARLQEQEKIANTAIANRNLALANQMAQVERMQALMNQAHALTLGGLTEEQWIASHIPLIRAMKLADPAVAEMMQKASPEQRASYLEGLDQSARQAAIDQFVQKRNENMTFLQGRATLDVDRMMMQGMLGGLF